MDDKYNSLFESNDDKITIVIRETSATPKTLIVFGIAIVVAICVVTFACLKSIRDNEYGEKVKGSISQTDYSYDKTVKTENMIYHRFQETGMVFPDSSKYLITANDVMELATCDFMSERELLRYAINELYARNGYQFDNGDYYWHYSSYGFLCNCSMEQALSKFNDVEVQNLDFLVEFESRRGYPHDSIQ